MSTIRRWNWLVATKTTTISDYPDYFVTTISALRALSPDLLQAVTAKTWVPGVSLRRGKLGCRTVAIRFQDGG